MGNPFSTDWKGRYIRSLRHDRRLMAAFIGIALILLPLPTVIDSHFHPEDGIFISICIMIYGASTMAGASALALYKVTRSLKKDFIRQAPVNDYARLLDLCRTYPKTGEQCRVAVADLLLQQGYLTAWQIELLTEDLKELGGTERLDVLKRAFSHKGICQLNLST